jgi:uncharacterized membrane protein
MMVTVGSTTLVLTILLCLFPIAELRGGLPFALARGMPLLPAYLVCVLANALVGPLVFLFLSTLHRLLERGAAYRRFFERIVVRARRKVNRAVERFGYVGLAVFVAIPLPLTGAYTGAVGAWVLGMSRWKSILAIAIGVAVAGVVISAVYLLGIQALYIFLKR